MRREGRQRGMVRATFPTLPSQYNPRRTIDEIRGPPTAGLFTKAPSKPTNHSKFTGKCPRPKCRGCHFKPACKSKDKAKGTHKVRPIQLMGLPGGVNVYRCSGTRILDYFDSNAGGDYDSEVCCFSDHGLYDDDTLSSGRDDEDDDKSSFCEVGFDLGTMDGDDEGWCMVEDST